jgi:glucose-6-phosphate isomerase
VVVKGIGSAILLQQLETNIVYNISRNAPEITLTSNIFGRCFEKKLPEIEAIDTLIYCLVLLT